jgi:hypothetical protein
LTPDDPVSLFEGAIALAIFTFLFLFSGIFLQFRQSSKLDFWTQFTASENTAAMTRTAKPA